MGLYGGKKKNRMGGMANGNNSGGTGRAGSQLQPRGRQTLIKSGIANHVVGSGTQASESK